MDIWAILARFMEVALELIRECPANQRKQNATGDDRQSVRRRAMFARRVKRRLTRDERRCCNTEPELISAIDDFIDDGLTEKEYGQLVGEGD